MIFEFAQTLAQYIQPRDRLVVAVSGGVDSMVLLDLLAEIHPRENLIIAHFDHSLRWVESDGDRAFVRDFCLERGLRYDEQKMDIGLMATVAKKSIEMMAREKRYEWLEKVRVETDATMILTAHHLGDRVETALFHLIRGTKLGGIAALRVQNARLLRPLLSFSKEAIREYAEKKELTWREDSSNLDSRYQRNHIRHDILPLFATINPHYEKSIGRFIEYASEAKDWIDSLVRDFLSIHTEKEKWWVLLFVVSEFLAEKPFLQREVIRYLYERRNHGTVWLSEGNMTEILRYINTAGGGTTKEIAGLKLSKQGKKIRVEK